MAVSKAFIIYAQKLQQDGSLSTLILDLRNQLILEDIMYQTKQITTLDELKTAEQIAAGTFKEGN